MTIQQRTEERKRRITGNQATDHADAELWDLIYWQSRTPEERLSALVHIHRDIHQIGRSAHFSETGKTE
jgi:hypothetical protein